MAINLKAITSVMGYQQITSLSSATKLTVPARDLSALEVRFYGEERLKNSGIYAEHIRKPKAEKPADSNIQEAKDGWN